LEHLKYRAVRKSFSIPEDMIELFEKEAENHDTTPSALLLQIMKKWLAFEMPLSEIGTITMANPCFQAMIEQMTPDDLIAVAQEQATRNFGILLSLLDGQFNLPSIIAKYYERFGKYSGWYTFRHSVTTIGYRLEFRHTRGIKWSRFLAEYNNVVLDNLSESTECHVDNSVVTFNVIPKQKSTIRY
jgi:hypothetical protein